MQVRCSLCIPQLICGLKGASRARHPGLQLSLLLR